MDKLILCDCDGVLLEWNAAFNEWAFSRGYSIQKDSVYDMHTRFDIAEPEAKSLIRQFNESAAIASLEPFRDALVWIPEIHRMGYRFRVITSMSLCPYAFKARVINLSHYFGYAIENVISLDCGAPKDAELSLYEGSNRYWIEDKFSNAVAGQELGLRAILMEHDYNSEDSHKDIPRVKSWKEIYEIIRTQNDA